jgi:hypothetical protein
MWQSRLILSSAIKEHVIHAPHGVGDFNTHHMDRKQDRTESNQSKLGKRVLHELNMKQDPKQHVVT